MLIAEASAHPDSNTKWVGQHRDKVDFSPKDVAKVNEFLREENAEGKV